MELVRLDPQRHSLLGEIATGLRALCRVPYDIHQTGRWQGIGAQPEKDRPRPQAIRHAFIGYPPVTLPAGARWQCANYFGPGDGIDWHTDSALPGWRIYVWRYSEGSGRMFYGSKVLEETGEGAYLFQTGAGCWHAVESAGHRFSVGVELVGGAPGQSDRMAEAIAALAGVAQA